MSARTAEPLFELSDGERVIVTSRKNIARPHDVDALLLRTETGLRWLSHRLVDELESAAVKDSWPTTIAARARAWDGQFSFRNEVPDDKGNVAEDKRGLRPPQVGALHAIGAHWSLYKQPATIVMPTGTGKTETMLSALAAYAREPLLVIVPLDALRGQTAGKFQTFGLLRFLGVLNSAAPNPIIACTFAPSHDWKVKAYFVFSALF
ncbi:DEAD/DEAH box helicase family protein [Allomesorhizobium alhagi]|uniref:Type III restriction enzyme, res subunit n=1 Tax=Mesorhizobium alhagi CCNWXJ12-2 TaxID=1107882 RepID=H0HUH6_9HYPH|nr:DEAD/DEAH box helicase family protein [Mesorhizobium alhagi]EHK55623.1 type III restriction enzyme, res subunit [Mesorhizobium alhagi CCNWXJ12-2]